jgi:hypothetical protein
MKRTISFLLAGTLILSAAVASATHTTTTASSSILEEMQKDFDGAVEEASDYQQEIEYWATSEKIKYDGYIIQEVDKSEKNAFSCNPTDENLPDRTEDCEAPASPPSPSLPPEPSPDAPGLFWNPIFSALNMDVDADFRPYSNPTATGEHFVEWGGGHGELRVYDGEGNLIDRARCDIDWGETTCSTEVGDLELCRGNAEAETYNFLGVGVHDTDVENHC